MWPPTPEPANSDHRHTLRHRLAAFETLLRYVQPVTDGYFCRNAVRQAFATIFDDIPQWVVVQVWADLSIQLPECHPGDTCC